MTYVIFPIIKDRREKTWVDLMLLRISKIEGTQFSLFCMVSTVTWMLYASLREHEVKITPFAEVLNGLLTPFILPIFLLIIVYDIKRLHICPSTNTRQDEADTSHSSSNADTFSLGSIFNPTLDLQEK